MGTVLWAMFFYLLMAPFVLAYVVAQVAWSLITGRDGQAGDRR